MGSRERSGVEYRRGLAVSYRSKRVLKKWLTNGIKRGRPNPRWNLGRAHHVDQRGLTIRVTQPSSSGEER